ncbi:MAG: proteasome subunit alpha [Nitrospinaceae bacterium]|nr:proteasome subunit alpha [Nitrospina sp.]MBT5375584.1 proteasome subunit alpha [Nitrospinaceae bacterium]MBT6346341.1 proteasome subunit alpha [Nitrospina sp.]
MFEEPYRWMEAVSTRHSYVQEKLKKGQPVLSVPYDDGVLIMGFAPQPGKIFEIYDRIALGGVGHPADVEKLRMTLLEMAHLEGFNRSAQDVTLARLLQFGVAPALKQNFEEIQRAPYILRLLLVELEREGNPNFFRINYDGHWETFKKGTVIAGNEKIMDEIQKEIESLPFATFSLNKALEETCRLWIESKKQEEEEGIPQTLKEVFDQWYLEGAVLSKKVERRAVYRALTQEEIDLLKSSVV